MKIISNIGKFAIIAALVLGVSSCSDDDDGDFVELETNLVLTATADSELSSLVAALGKAELVATLNGSGPFTVLAPTDAAFTTFLEANNYASINDVPVETLKQVLLNHVIPGEFTAAALKAEGTGYAETASTAGPNGENISIYYNATGDVVFNGGKSNGGGKVTTADIEATNGIIHKVDAVIELPKVTTFAVADARFSTLVTALTDANLVGALQVENGTGTPEAPFTVFAPTNDAFAKLSAVPTGSALTDVLLLHVIEKNNVTSSELTTSTVVSLGGNLDIDATAVTVKGEGNAEASAIIITDVQSTNGVIHAIDQVLLPM
ncbi:fasciclin domain-containing protein [Aquimarina sp. 2-A2]|uniref:fasciclin domain-containing protein n=1 Tax=Aquimarina sp. 2-A2 TaxID=3382644 RepID=UPI00387F149B